MSFMNYNVENSNPIYVHPVMYIATFGLVGSFKNSSNHLFSNRNNCYLRYRRIFKKREKNIS